MGKEGGAAPRPRSVELQAVSTRYSPPPPLQRLRGQMTKFKANQMSATFVTVILGVSITLVVATIAGVRWHEKDVALRLWRTTSTRKGAGHTTAVIHVFARGGGEGICARVPT